MKKCKTCKEDKPFDKFNIDRKSKDGLRYNCTQCDVKRLRIRTINTWANRVIDQTKRRHANHQTIKNSKSGEYDLDAQFIIDLFNSQDGRCSITGLKMSINAKEMFMASLERNDDSVTYRRDNVTFIIAELNSAQKVNVEKMNRIVNSFIKMPHYNSSINAEPSSSETMHNGQEDHPET